MTRLRTLLDQVPLTLLAVLCVTLGLAPFLPEPHVLEKLGMLFTGTLTAPVDMLDLAFHGLPWALLVLKLLLRPGGPTRT